MALFASATASAHVIESINYISAYTQTKKGDSFNYLQVDESTLAVRP